MSLTTRCPACSTRFRVVPDQLKISDGWVRCGHCSNVFDATVHLSAWIPAALPVQAVEAVPEPTPEPVQPAVPQDPMPSAEPLMPSDASEPLDLDLSSQLPDGEPIEAAAEGGITAEPEPDATTEPLMDTTAAAAGPQVVPGFVQQARRQAVWRSAPVRASLMVLVLLFSTLLAAQWALQQRSWLAARHPALKPWLVQACDALGCTVEPLRRIDAIVIESAALVRRLGQFHSFDIVLQNTADLPLAAPALELSLTDASDRVIARRVFLPQEWPQSVTELPPRATVPVSFRLSIASGDDLPMAGYRALVFYP